MRALSYGSLSNLSMHKIPLRHVAGKIFLLVG